MSGSYIKLNESTLLSSIESDILHNNNNPWETCLVFPFQINGDGGRVVSVVKVVTKCDTLVVSGASPTLLHTNYLKSTASKSVKYMR